MSLSVFFFFHPELISVIGCSYYAWAIVEDASVTVCLLVCVRQYNGEKKKETHHLPYLSHFILLQVELKIHGFLYFVL